MGLPYIPHITIGKLSEKYKLGEAYNQVKDMSETFCALYEIEVLDM